MRWWMVTIAPLIRQFSLRSNCHLLHRRGEGFWYAAANEAMCRASVGFPWGKLCAAQPLCDEGIATAYNLLGRVTYFSLIRQFSRWSNCHLPRIAASPRGKAFGRPHAKKQCAAPVFLPLLRGRWRGAPDEVVDGDDRPPHQPLSGHKKTALPACRRGIAVVGNSFRSGTRALSLRLCGLRQGGGGCGWRRPFRRSALRGQLR